MMTPTTLAEIRQFCHDKGFADRHPYAKQSAVFEMTAGRKRLAITICPGSNSMFYATNIPLHCFRSSGSRYLSNAHAAAITIAALAKAFDNAIKKIKAKYKIAPKIDPS